MGTIWVLDTDTKGTGAQMVPLEKVLREPETGPARRFVAPEPEPRPAAEPAPRPPARFRVVDVLSGRVMSEDVGVRATVAALEDVRSFVDVSVYAWEDDDWRLLTARERKLLWARRGRAAGAGVASSA